MYLKPMPLGDSVPDDSALRADRTACRKYGPCGVGEQALYLNTLFLDRRLYIPIKKVRRAFKRIAMSKGGFTGQGVFGTLPYLVVEYGSGQSIQCRFKYEEQVDLLLADLKQHHPEIPTMSEAALRRLREAEAEETAKLKKHLSPTAQESIQALEQAKAYLDERPELSIRLAGASKALRVNRTTNPAAKWVALVIFIMALLAAAYGGWSLLTHAGDGQYFLLLGLAGLFFFSSSRVLPTARNNRSYLEKNLQQARGEMEQYLAGRPDFPLPARYAHPACLTRMIRSIRYGRSETVEDAFADMKAVLKATNADVQVSQTEYDEIVAVKPMFLLENYQ